MTSETQFFFHKPIEMVKEMYGLDCIVEQTATTLTLCVGGYQFSVDCEQNEKQSARSKKLKMLATSALRTTDIDQFYLQFLRPKSLVANLFSRVARHHCVQLTDIRLIPISCGAGTGLVGFKVHITPYFSVRPRAFLSNHQYAMVDALLNALTRPRSVPPVDLVRGDS